MKKMEINDWFLFFKWGGYVLGFLTFCFGLMAFVTSQNMKAEGKIKSEQIEENLKPENIAKAQKLNRLTNLLDSMDNYNDLNSNIGLFYDFLGENDFGAESKNLFEEIITKSNKFDLSNERLKEIRFQLLKFYASYYTDSFISNEQLFQELLHSNTWIISLDWRNRYSKENYKLVLRKIYDSLQDKDSRFKHYYSFDKIDGQPIWKNWLLNDYKGSENTKEQDEILR